LQPKKKSRIVKRSDYERQAKVSLDGENPLEVTKSKMATNSEYPSHALYQE
jgi:hypothetical protein